MTYAHDVEIVQAVLKSDLMRGPKWKVKVCNHHKTNPGQISDVAGKDKVELERQCKGAGGEFYSQLGERLATQCQTWGGNEAGLDCVGMSALLFGLLKRKGFEGRVERGLIGKSASFGHVFLVLHNGCCNNPALVLDLWSFLYPHSIHTPTTPLVSEPEFSGLLPTKDAVSMLSAGMKLVSLQPEMSPC